MGSDYPADSVDEAVYVEVDQKADLASGVLQVRQQLGDVNRVQCQRRLELDDDATLDHSIDPIAAIQSLASKADRIAS